VSAVTLARIGPVKPFLDKSLTAQSGGMRPNRRHRLCSAAALAQRRVGGETGRTKGTHSSVSAISAEIAGGTLPEKRFSRRFLRRSVPVQHARVGQETARAAARRTGRPAW
jgi:hypothetical protein